MIQNTDLRVILLIHAHGVWLPIFLDYFMVILVFVLLSSEWFRHYIQPNSLLVDTYSIRCHLPVSGITNSAKLTYFLYSFTCVCNNGRFLIQLTVFRQSAELNKLRQDYARLVNELTEKTGKLQQEEVQKKNAEQAVTQLKVKHYLYLSFHK